MPPEEADRDPHGRLEAGGGGGGSTPEPGPIPNEHAPPGALASLARVSSSMSVARSAVSEVVEREIEEADLMGNEELVRELATPGPRFAPLKTAREMTAAVAAPYGPDEPMSLQNVLRGQGASVFVMNYVPSIGQSMAKTALQIRDRIHVPYLPCIRTLQNYTGGDLFHDLIAALTCAVLVTPECLSYMVLATLDPVIGLYSAAVGPFMFAFFGTAKHLSIGPISLGSIYIPIALKQLGFDVNDATDGARAERAEAAGVLTFYVFAIFLVMSILRLGSVIRFVSHAVMAGFVTATGIFVSINELRHLLNLHMPKTFEYNFQKIGWLFTHLHEAKDASAALGMGSLAVLLGVKMIKRCYPATPERMQSKMFKLWYYLSSFTLLIVVVAAAGIAYTLEKRGVEVHILGDLAAGLGAPRAPELGKFEFKSMISPALQVSLLSYIEASSISRKYADAFDYWKEMDTNQDLFGLAASNLLTCTFGGVIVSGSFSRTALAAEVGGRTPFTNLYLGIFVIIFVYHTQILYYIPYAVLGALIVSAMINLVNVREFFHALRIARTSGYIMLFTFACTLLISIESGLVYGVMASLILLLCQLSDVDAVVLGQERGPNGELHLVSLRDNPRAVPCDPKGGVIVLRPVASLFFGNAECLEDEIQRVINAIVEARGATPSTGGRPEHIDRSGGKPTEAAAAAATAGGCCSSSNNWPFEARKRQLAPMIGAANVGPETRFILVNASGIRLLDLAALSCVVDVVEDAQREGISVVFAGCSNKLKASLKACGLYRRVGGPLTMHSAEEVYSLLVDAPAHVPSLANQATLVNLPPRYHSASTSGAGSVSTASGAATVAMQPPIREE